MNRAEKIVFSRTLKSAAWNNTRVASDLEGEVAKLKAAGRNMTILGSGSIITQLAERGLIDEYQFMVDPLALPAGRSIFTGLKSRLNLQLVSTRAFNNGAVLLCYRSA
jgi:dihydrofolate reductase